LIPEGRLAEEPYSGDAIATGFVKWFDNKKGYGFIVGGDEADVFVHFSSIRSDGFRTLKPGMEVEFRAVRNDKGWKAKEVSLRTAPAPA